MRTVRNEQNNENLNTQHEDIIKDLKKNIFQGDRVNLIKNKQFSKYDRVIRLTKHEHQKFSLSLKKKNSSQTNNNINSNSNKELKKKLKRKQKQKLREAIILQIVRMTKTDVKKQEQDINVSMMMITILATKSAIIKTKFVAKIKNQDLINIEKSILLLLLLLSLPKEE